ncbi:MAG: DUF2125 domain-containing protein [Kiloniellales bacterium]
MIAGHDEDARRKAKSRASRSMLPRRLIAAVLGAALLAFGALSAYWFWAADQVATAIALWTEEQRARGYEIAYQGPELGGFPVKLAVRFTEPRVAAPQGWRWSGAAIAGEAAFWAPRSLRLDLPRRQTLTAVWRGHERDLTLEAEAARGFVHLGREGWLQAATVEMEALALSEQGGGTTRAERLRYDLTRRPPTLEGTDDWTLLLRGETLGVVLPEGTPKPLGERVERIAFEATLIGIIPKGPPAEALARWRDAGGLIEIAALTLVWGPLELAAEGTAALDQELRPQGAFTARIHGLPETLDAFAAHGLIEPGVALALRFTALVLATRKDASGRAVVELPITLQDGLFYLGPAALFPLAPVL